MSPIGQPQRRSPATLSSLLPGVALPIAMRFTRSRFVQLGREMRRHERATRDAIEVLQAERLQTLFAVADAHTRFWPERLAAAGAPGAPPREVLSRLPPVSKGELEAGFPDQVTNRASPQEDWRFAATRGTTQRMICVHDFPKRDAIRAAIARTLSASGGYRLGMPMVEIPPDICDTVCGEQGERDEGVLSQLAGMIRQKRLRDPAAYRDLRGLVERHWIYRRKTYPPFGPRGSNPPVEQLDAYIARLQRDRPYLVKGLTTYLYQIAKRALARPDVRLRVPIIKPLGSGATPVMRAVIEKGFGGRFYDDYGSAELGAVACDCDLRRGMHVFEDLFIVEVIDSDGLRRPAGSVGEVVVTDLMNHAMPLIRYRLGDLGRLDDAPCPCGRTAPRLHLEGRALDALRDARGEWVTSHAIADRMYQEPSLDQFQLVEKPDGTIDVAVVPTTDGVVDSDCVERIVHGLLDRDVRVRVRASRTIAPEPGGKFRWVKAAAARQPYSAAGATVVS